MPWLINAAQVDKFRKSQKSLIILDASYHLPHENRNANQEFSDKHIIDAHFFDINAFNDTHADLPHKLITDEKAISEMLGSMGIRNDYKIIFYDNSGLHSAYRAAWMMKYFGHNPHLIYVLDGGLDAWDKYIGKTTTGTTSATPRKYQAKLQSQCIVALKDMKENLQHQQTQVIDVRHALRYAGGPEPRPGLRSGHIPGSSSFPYMSFFDKSGTLLPLEKIRTLLTSVAIDVKAPIIATCGSSITAAILDFVLDLLGHKQHVIYEGSWMEWGAEKLYAGEVSLEERPIETSVESDEPTKIE